MHLPAHLDSLTMQDWIRFLRKLKSNCTQAGNVMNKWRLFCLNSAGIVGLSSCPLHWLLTKWSFFTVRVKLNDKHSSPCYCLYSYIPLHKVTCQINFFYPIFLDGFFLLHRYYGDGWVSFFKGKIFLIFVDSLKNFIKIRNVNFFWEYCYATMAKKIHK